MLRLAFVLPRIYDCTTVVRVNLSIKVTSEQAAAYAEAAKKSNVKRHSWMVASLDAAAVLPVKPVVLPAKEVQSPNDKKQKVDELKELIRMKESEEWFL